MVSGEQELHAEVTHEQRSAIACSRDVRRGDTYQCEFASLIHVCPENEGYDEAWYRPSIISMP
jgi:hypothetical protein